MTKRNLNALCSTGIPGLDAILGGGLPRHHMYLIQGEPGTGKTTLGLQFLMEGARGAETSLYVTFSETRDELLSVAASHAWNLDGIELLELSAVEPHMSADALNTLFHPAEIELNEITRVMIEHIDRIKPKRVVFDSVSEMRMLSEVSTRFRRIMLALKQRLTADGVTVLLLDDLTASPRELQIHSIVHGVVLLQMTPMDFGAERRRIMVTKLRGARFRGGYHDYILRKGGMQVFPRLSAAEHYKEFTPGAASSGIEPLDALLGGGLDRGTSSLLIGPAGSGKSTIALQCAAAAAARGEQVAIYSFEETLATLLQRTRAIGIPIEKYLRSGDIRVTNIDAAEIPPGELIERIRAGVEREHVQFVVIDSLNGFIHAMPQEQSIMLQLHELLSYLNRQGVVTIVVLAQQGLMGPMQTPIDVTYLADATIVTRYFENAGAVRKAVSVVKKRSGAHEDTIREFTIGPNGIVVGDPLRQFRGIMTGVPIYVGAGTGVREAKPEAHGRD